MDDFPHLQCPWQPEPRRPSFEDLLEAAGGAVRSRVRMAVAGPLLCRLAPQAVAGVCSEPQGGDLGPAM